MCCSMKNSAYDTNQLSTTFYFWIGPIVYHQLPYMWGASKVTIGCRASIVCVADSLYHHLLFHNLLLMMVCLP